MKKISLTFFVCCVGIIGLFVINPMGFKEKLFFNTKRNNDKSNSTNITVSGNTKSVKHLNKLEINDIPIKDFGGEFSAIQDKLSECSGGETFRIAYFGDSIIEGDLISSTLRTLLQNHYGNGGAGLLQIAPDNSGFRDGISQSFSDNWLKYSLLKNKPSDCIYGLSGYLFKTSSDSILNTQPLEVSFDLNSGGYKTARILYSNNKNNSKVKIIYNSESVTEVILPRSSTVVEYRFKPEGGKKIKLEFEVDEGLCLFGVSFEMESGVIIDNFALRGHSGLLLKKINSAALEQFNSLLKYDLIILQYGANVSDESVKEFGWYGSGMSSVIRHLRSGFPDCPILVISATDRAYKDINGFHSSPAIRSLVSSQESAARNTGSGFWNLYEVMGGENSMFAWVDAGLASKDFIHLNHEGAGKVGRMLYNSLIRKPVKL